MFTISYLTIALASFIYSKVLSSSIFLIFGSESCSRMESLAPVWLHICFEFTPSFPMMASTNDASTLILVMAEAPKLATGSIGDDSIRPAKLPGMDPMARGSSWYGASGLLSSHLPWAKWHLSPNLQPSVVLNLLHILLLSAGIEEPFGTGGGCAGYPGCDCDRLGRMKVGRCWWLGGLGNGYGVDLGVSRTEFAWVSNGSRRHLDGKWMTMVEKRATRSGCGDDCSEV